MPEFEQLAGPIVKVSTRKVLKEKFTRQTADQVEIIMLPELKFFTESDEKIVFVSSSPTANYNDTFNNYKSKAVKLLRKTTKIEKKNKNFQKPFEIRAGLLFHD